MIPIATTSVLVPTMLAAMPSLTPLYIICLIVGFGLLVISTVFGGDQDHELGFDGHTDALDVHADVDMSADLHVDTDVDTGLDGATDVHLDQADAAVDHAADMHAPSEVHEHGALAISNWFSIRFLVYFAAAFGLVGTILTYLSDVTPGWTAVWAVGSGLVLGQGVHQTLRALRRTSGGRGIRPEDYLNQTARVTVAIHPPKRGEVAVRVYNGERFLSAVSKRPDDEFHVGDRVVITGYASGTAEVVSQKEHEFLNAS
jgi:membrane protein implicated in regulation of membrane protease activity